MAGLRIVYVQDGKVRVVVPSPHSKLSLLEIMQRSVPADATNVMTVHSSELPADRTFRNAWALENGAVKVERTRAEQIVLDKVRKEREAEFAKTDAEFMAAVQRKDAGKEKAASDRAQALRDVTAKDLSKLSIEQLAALDLNGMLALPN